MYSFWRLSECSGKSYNQKNIRKITCSLIKGKKFSSWLGIYINVISYWHNRPSFVSLLSRNTKVITDVMRYRCGMPLWTSLNLVIGIFCSIFISWSCQLKEKKNFWLSFWGIFQDGKIYDINSRRLYRLTAFFVGGLNQGLMRIRWVPCQWATSLTRVNYF